MGWRREENEVWVESERRGVWVGGEKQMRNGFEERRR